MGKKVQLHLLYSIQIVILFMFSSCSDENVPKVDHSFEIAINAKHDIKDFDKVDFKSDKNLDLGFFKGHSFIKLSISNNKKPATFIVLCNDLINRNYRFYKLDKEKNTLIPNQIKIDLEKYDHRSFNFSKPNFKIDLDANEKAIYYITTSSDGRILQGSPKLITTEDFLTIKKQAFLFDIIFYGLVIILLFINLFYFRKIRSSINYFYASYILSGCLMYLFVEGRLYGHGISHKYIDHLMFISIRIWIVTSILFSMSFLETKITNLKFYKFILLMLCLSLGGTTVYQLVFYEFSISTLHVFDNVLGFIWVGFALIIIAKGFKKRKLESTYYFISYSIFIFFVILGLIDSHTAILPGDPFLYFKIGTIFEFIGFTYFISLLIKRRIDGFTHLENKLLQNKNTLILNSKILQEKDSLLSSKTGVEKTDLISAFKLLENSLSAEAEWDEFKLNIKEMNSQFLEKLLIDYPDLTKSEIRLLTLIKIGYSQKEMASILNIAPNSVKKAKNRVRKKLKIPINTHLEDFL